jgi:hypothetical protein
MTDEPTAFDVDGFLRQVGTGHGPEHPLLGEHLWTNDAGDRGYARRTAENSVLTIVYANGVPDYIHLLKGVDYRRALQTSSS